MGQGDRRVNAGEQTVRVHGETGEPGAARAAERKDVVVIVDALRASATIIAALWAGASCVIPVRTIEQAAAYLDLPHYRVAGERDGARVRNFHYGNSPTEMLAHRRELAGRTLVLTTSNGTRCIDAAMSGATHLLVGSTLNATAVAQAALALAQASGRDIALVAVGYYDRLCPEDSFAIRLIATRLRDLGAIPGLELPPADAEDSLDVFLASGAAARLIALGYECDVHLCAQVDKWRVTPVYDASQRGFVA